MSFKSLPVTRVEGLEGRRLLSIEPVGGEFQANDFTLGDQIYPAVAMDADGDYTVAWHSYWETTPGALRDVQVRRFDADGTPLGKHFIANTTRVGNQTNADVAMDDAGNAVTVWFGNSDLPGPIHDVLGRRIDASGVPVGSEFRVTSGFNGGEHPSIAMNGAGAFVVAWFSGPSNDYDVHARRFAADGTPLGDQFRVNTFTNGLQFFPDVDVAEDGSFTVIYVSEWDVRGQRFDAQGARVGDEFLVNTFTTGMQLGPDVAYDADGNFVVAWNSYEQDGFEWGIYGQRFAADGSRRGGEFRINEHTSASENSPQVVYEPGGGFTVVWHTNQRGDGADSYARRFRADGTPRGGEWRVNTSLPNKATNPRVAIDVEGDLVAVWMSDAQDNHGFGITGQRFRIAPPTVAASSFAFATAPHALRFTFDGALPAATFDPADLVLQNVTTGQTIPASDVGVSFDEASGVATFTYLAGGGVLPDGNYRATLLAAGVEDEQGDPLPADHVFDFVFLTGDANHDGRVNLQDFNILAAHFGQSPRDFTQGDFNYDGTVNLADFNLLAARFGAALAAGGFTVVAGAGSNEDDDEADELLA